MLPISLQYKKKFRPGRDRELGLSRLLHFFERLVAFATEIADEPKSKAFDIRRAARFMLPPTQARWVYKIASGVPRAAAHVLFFYAVDFEDFFRGAAERRCRISDDNDIANAGGLTFSTGRSARRGWRRPLPRSPRAELPFS